ncbi:MAG: CAP domain-containing protein, partial [Chloroflexi bacterium]|nr:CAP domain-containing protein [Chloroflexota bacterium]
MILFLFPSLLPLAPDFVEETATKIDNLVREIEGEQIEELSPEQLPSGVLPDRSLYNIERETFTLMNQERVKRNIDTLEWDERIANTAFKHSKEMGINDYVNHTNLAGVQADKRLTNDRIFNVCNSENIFFIESRNSKIGLAEKAVEGWLNSPGHRRNLLDDKITKAGVGIYCEGRRCYVNTNHICTTTEITETLQDRFVYFFSIYPKEIKFDIPIQIEFNLEVTEKADIFIVPDSSQYQNYIKRRSYLFTKEYKRVTEIIDFAVVERGYGFMIVPSDD